jgi:hypothetical protein
LPRSMWQGPTVVSKRDWKLCQKDLQEVFGFASPPDPDPSEWFPTDEFYRFKPVLDAVRKKREAAAILERSHARRVARDRDRTNDRVVAAHEQAAEAFRAAELELARLESDEAMDEIRFGAETRLNELRSEALSK